MNNYQDKVKYQWIVFMLWPFVMFLFSLANIFNRNSQKFILAFSFLYGYSVFLYSGDILRYEKTFAEVVTYKWADFYYLITHFMSPSKYESYGMNSVTRNPDIYSLFMNFFVSRFTDNPRWFWAFISFIHTFLIINLLNSIKKEFIHLKSCISQKIFFAGLILIVPFYYGVIGVRFWPALLIFVTYGLQFSSRKKIKYLLYASTSILFHYSFALPVLLLFLIFILPKSRKFYKLLLICGLVVFSFSSISSTFQFLKGVSSNLEETTIDDATSSYTNEEFVERRNNQKILANWYVRGKDNIMLFFLLLIGIMDVLGIVKFKENQYLFSTYPLMVIFLIFVLLVKDLGTLSRFKYIFYILFLVRYIILTGIQPMNRQIRSISYSFAPILLFYSLINFRAGFYTVDPVLLISNSISLFFAHSDISLSEFLIGH